MRKSGFLWLLRINSLQHIWRQRQWWKGGRKSRAWRSSVFTLLYIWKGQSSLCDPEHICPILARYFSFSSSESFSFYFFFPPVVVVPAESSCLLWRLKATCQPPPQTRSLRLPWRPSIFANSECRWMENGSACASWTTSHWHPTQSLPTKVRSGSLPRDPRSRCIVTAAAQVGRGCLWDEMLLACLENLDTI